MSTSFLPEPPTPVADAVPFQPVKAKRKSWTQAMVADLVFCSTQPGFIANEEQHAKLVELGLRKKPQKMALDPDKFADTGFRLGLLIAEYPIEQRTLAIRAAIKHLQGMLPARPAK